MQVAIRTAVRKIQGASKRIRMTLESGEIFQSWDLYSRIVHNNWMRHREMNEAIDRCVAMCPQPIRVLDLGCGDGSMACAGLNRFDVAQYVGIDLSGDALKLLARRSGPGTRKQQTVSQDPVDCTKETLSIGATSESLKKLLFMGDMREQLRGLPSASFDVVIASYSLHHYSSLEKREALDHVVRVLAPGGQFIWIDIARQGDEGRADYLDRIEEEIHLNWVGMPAGEQSDAIEHIRNCDFPETTSWMEAEWMARGGAFVECLYRDPFYGCWAMRRGSSSQRSN